MLVPVYSNWFYAALSIYDCQECVSIFGDGLFGNSSKFFYELVSQVFFNFGAAGIGIFHLILIFIAVLFLQADFFKKSESKDKKGLTLICLILTLGVMFYGQDFHPVLFFIPLILIQVLIVSKIQSSTGAINSLCLCLTSVLVNYLARYVDLRADYLSLFAYFYVFLFDKKNLKLTKLSYLIIFILSYLLTGEYASHDLVNLSELPSFGALSHGLPYDFAFLIILIFIFFFTRKFRLRDISVYGFVILLFILSCYSYVIKIITSYLVSSLIICGATGKVVDKLEQSIELLGNKIKLISSEGLLFLLMSICFVSITSHLKYPISDYIYPKKSVDSLIERGECPTLFSKNVLGYLVYRYGHDRQCLEKISMQIKSGNLSSICEEFNIKSGSLGSMGYCRLPDVWR